jgi:high mobility group protein B1
MNEKEEKIFHEMADKDKMRYNTNMQSYIPLKGKNVYFKKQRPIKDPNAPKRSLLIFFH